jgi:hypothetical protein
MPKKDSASGPPTAETRNAVFNAFRDTPGPVTAGQLSKLLIAPHKLSEKKLTPVLDDFVADGALRVIPPATAKGKPRYWDRDLGAVAPTAVVTAMQQAPEPLTAKEIVGRIVLPFKLTEAEMTPFLEDQVALQALYVIPAKTAAGKPRYWNHDLGEFVRGVVLQILNSKGPQTSKDLQKALKGLTDSQFQQEFERLIVTRAVVSHPPLGKKGKSLFGSQPPQPEPYLKEVGTTLSQIVTQLRSAQVPIENLRRAVIQLIEAAGIPFGSTPVPVSKPPVAGPSATVDLVSLMRRIEPAADRGALVAPRALRNAARIGKQEFDEAVMELAATGRISLHRHDYVASLTAAERDDLVTDGAGTYYVGLALRQTTEA